MSFLSKALRRAEVFLEQVDESVAQASRRAVVEDATGDVEGESWMPMSDDPLAAGVMEAGAAADSDADGVDVASRPPVQRRRGIANIRRAPIGRSAAAVGEGSSSVDDGAREEQTSVAGTHGSVGSARSPPGSIVSTHVPDSLAATDEPAEEKEPNGDEGDGWGDFDIPDSKLEGSGSTPDVRASKGISEISATAILEGEAPSAGPEVEPMSISAPAVAGKSAPVAVVNEELEASPNEEANNPTAEPAARAEPSTMEDAGRNDAGMAGVDGAVREGILRTNFAGSGDSVPSTDVTNGGSMTAASHADALAPDNNEAKVAVVRVDVPIAPQGPLQPAGVDNTNIGAAEGNEHDDSIRALMDENDELRKELELAEEDFDNMLKERSKLVQNLKSLKEVIAEQEEFLEEKSTEVRRLGEAMVEIKDERKNLQRHLKDTSAKGKDSLDLLQKKLTSQLSSVKAELEKSQVEEERLRAENVYIKDALAKGREVDMMTADGARDEASKAQKAYEAEAAAHRETREALKTRQEALDSESSLAADAIAAAQRKGDEAQAGVTAAREAQRAAESRLTRITQARDAALARIEDLSKELAPYKSSGDGQPPGHEELKFMQQTVVELEHALEAKNVELTRLEGDVENMRSLLSQRSGPSRARSPGGVVGAGGEFANGHEVEQKLRHMADSALRKQAQVEVLRSENKALQHQLDTERKRTREAQAMAAVATSSRHNLRGGFRGIVDGNDEERGERGYGVREGPVARFRAPRGWPAGVTRFLASLDKLTAQALGFLRKEPLIRMALLLYVVAVHVVLYSLLHYHVERTLADPAETVRVHPQEPLLHVRKA